MDPITGPDGAPIKNRRMVLRTFCFNCGREIRNARGESTSICRICEARYAEREEPLFTVRSRDGQQQGPWTRQQVIDQFNRGALEPESMISESGSRYVRLEHHDHFMNYFIPGDPRWQEVRDALGARDRSVARRIRRRRVEIVMFMAVVVAAIVGPWLMVQTKSTVLSESALEKASAMVDRGLIFMTENFGIGDYAPEAELPGGEVIAAVQSVWPQAHGPVDKYMEAAWPGLLRGDVDGAARARAHLEQAVAAHPEDPTAIATLAIAYTTYASADSQFHERSVSLLNRARAIDEGHPATLRAQASIGVINGSYPRAADRARDCISIDESPGYCKWYLGEAQLGMGDLKQARATLLEAHALLPQAPGVQLALVRIAMAQDELLEALVILEGLLEIDPEDSRLHDYLARIYRTLGEFDLAYDHAKQAIEMDENLLEPQLILGEVLLYVRDKPEEAARILAAASDSPNLFRAERAPEILIQASNAARAAGILDQAEALAQRATKRYPDRPAAYLALAMAKFDRGDLESAQGALGSVDVTALPDVDVARYHVLAARVYLTTDQQRLARSELKSAIDADPGWFYPRLRAAKIDLEIGSPTQAIDALSGGAQYDLNAHFRRSPITLSWFDESPDSEVETLFKVQFPTDAQLNRLLPRVLGLIESHRCWESGSRSACSRARDQLEIALRADSSDATAQVYMAHHSLRSERHRDALERMDRVLARSGDQALFYALRGRALYGMEDNSEGEATFKRAYQVTAEDAAIYRYHAEALLPTDKRRALEQYRMTTQFDPLDLESQKQQFALEREIDPPAPFGDAQKTPDEGSPE